MSITNNVARAKTDYDDVYEAGKKSQYDEFWDRYQDSGLRTDYKYGFAGNGWKVQNFRPKYNIVIANGTSTFQQCKVNASLKEIVEQLGISFSITTSSVTNMFVDSEFTELPEIDLSRATYPASTFQSMKSLHTLPIILPTAQKVNWNKTFNVCTELVNLSLTGKIYNRDGNALNLSWSKKLSKASIINVIECLDESVVDQYITLSLTAVNKAFETSAGAADGSTSAEWNALIATRSNWTINLLDS
jgi:hypothetical protein